MEASNSKYLTIDFHFNGMFAPNPLVYLDPMRMSVRDVDFGGMNYRKFVLWVSKLTRRSCENLYYCSTHERLAEGIRRIENDVDYFEFIEDGYMDKQELRMNVYIDHENEPILDWADKELLTGDELSDVIEDDDTESQISDIRECEHEPDEEVHTFDKTDDDEFLNKLCGKPILNSNQEEVNDADNDEDSDKDDEVVFPVFDEKQEWDKMVPVLGMKSANPLELKLCLTNYAVKNGERGDNRSACPQRPSDAPPTSGKVDLEAELEVEHVVMFESESDSDFESESDVEANVPEVDVLEPDVEAEVDVPEVYVIQDDIQVDANIDVDVLEVDLVPEVEVDANIEDEIQANIEVEHEIEVQDNVEQEIQHNAENQVRKRTRKTSERITKIQIRKNIRRNEGSSTDHPLEI
ncbi:unnamed protein product [Lactuca saligna]|uniref:Uncharacterized protein n=1 Tax=Lactuca saligna TaxID=75948 RepID=A0AA36EG42_LACSI|nr:unnamed protein product [Lactuca saligna]